MSHQGEISHGREVGFGLIETLLWTRDGGFSLFGEHLTRLERSSRSLGFEFDKEAVAGALARTVDAASAPRLRVRLVASRDGRLETSVAAIEAIAPETVWRVAPARRRFSSSDPLLRHKTTRRDLYESEIVEAQARVGADEVLFLNERDEVCEGARCNVFLAREGALLTPPLSSGLLPGTLRAQLLESGHARECVLHIEDFTNGAEFYMGNSVRGLVRAQLLAEPDAGL
jgi:branched-subunit amino acid aminotransferase/4-amino-4-deoxychorismate lyase